MDFTPTENLSDQTTSDMKFLQPEQSGTCYIGPCGKELHDKSALDPEDMTKTTIYAPITGQLGEVYRKG
jgi:hypothetical protein